MALDPGDTTGLAHYVCSGDYVHGNRTSELEVRALFTAVQLTSDVAVSYVEQLATDARTRVGLTIVYERFVPRRRSYAHSHQPTPHHVIGSLRGVSRRLHVPYVEQGPSDAKHVGKSSVMQRLGLWTPGQQHANDAAAHLLLALIRLHPYEASRLYRHGRVVVERT